MMHLTWILLIFTSLYIWCQEKFGGQKVERLVQLTGQAPARRECVSGLRVRFPSPASLPLLNLIGGRIRPPKPNRNKDVISRFHFLFQTKRDGHRRRTDIRP